MNDKDRMNTIHYNDTVQYAATRIRSICMPAVRLPLLFGAAFVASKT